MRELKQELIRLSKLSRDYHDLQQHHLIWCRDGCWKRPFNRFPADPELVTCPLGIKLTHQRQQAGAVFAKYYLNLPESVKVDIRAGNYD